MRPYAAPSKKRAEALATAAVVSVHRGGRVCVAQGRHLALYAEPYDPRDPVVGLDEMPYQLVSEVRRPLPMTPGPASPQ